MEFSYSPLEWICRTVLESAIPRFRNAGIEVSFYPYVGLRHTIRRKGNKWVLRISDHCRYAPREVLEAITIILICKVMRRRAPNRVLLAYDDFSRDPSVVEAVRQRRLERGRKCISDAGGRYHSPQDIYQELNSCHFNGQVEISKIGWGPRNSWERLGHYDPVHHTVTISPVLDSPRVPGFVVAYVVYHEMLHALFEDRPDYGPRRHHTPEFRRAEEAYPDYRTAKEFLKEFCKGGKRAEVKRGLRQKCGM